MNTLARPLQNPLVLFLVALALGTLWLTRPGSPRAPISVPVPVSHPATAPAPTALPRPVPEKPAPLPAADRLTAREQAEAERELATALRTEAQEVRADISAAEESFAAESQKQEALLVDEKALADRVQSLRQRLAELEAERLAAPQAVKTTASPELLKLQAEIQQRQEAASRLEHELKVGKSTTDTDHKGKILRLFAPQGKVPEVIELVDNHIVPMNSSFYRFKQTGTIGVLAVRKKEGETIAEARQPGSAFLKFLTRMKPDRQYVSCLLNSDSFEAFQAVKELAVQHGFEISWEPSETHTGEIPIVPVKLLENPHGRRQIPLPDILK